MKEQEYSSQTLEAVANALTKIQGDWTPSSNQKNTTERREQHPQQNQKQSNYLQYTATIFATSALASCNTISATRNNAPHKQRETW